MHQDILVSIACITFNHSKYIRQTLDGFLSQQISGGIEILIHDDASTDGTIEVLKEYAAQHPDKFVLFLEDENQYGKGRSYFLELFRRSRGKYIAICEGDDYWIDPQKLSQQIKILQQHPECVACCHNQIVVDKTGAPWPDSYQKIYRQETDIILDRSFLRSQNKFSHTASLLIRSELFRDLSDTACEDYLRTKANGDMKWAAMIAACGKIYHIAKDMACYRYVPSGTDSWSARNAGKNITLSTYNQLEQLQAFIDRIYHVRIDYSGNMERLWRTAVTTWLKKPNKTNRSILKQLSEKQHKHFFDVIKFLFHQITQKLSCRKTQKQV